MHYAAALFLLCPFLLLKIRNEYVILTNEKILENLIVSEYQIDENRK